MPDKNGIPSADMEGFPGASVALKKASPGACTADVIGVPRWNLTVASLKPLRQMLLVSSGGSEGLFPGNCTCFVGGTAVYP